MKTKTIPFDLETAKKIQAGEMDGKIKTREGQIIKNLEQRKASAEIMGNFFDIIAVLYIGFIAYLAFTQDYGKLLLAINVWILLVIVAVDNHKEKKDAERLLKIIKYVESQYELIEAISPKSPWRDASVEKPPYDTDCDDETSVCVIVRQDQGNVLEAYYDYENNDWRDREHNWRLQDPTHWMPIPEV